jgi:hypothetical protein
MTIFQEILDKIEKERGLYNDLRNILVDKYHYETNDCRTGILEQINRLLIYHNINLVHFIRCIVSENYIPDLFKTSSSDSIEIRRDYYVRNKHSLFIFLQSVIEAYFGDLYSYLNLGNLKGFDKILKSVFETLNISIESNSYKSIKILNLIRNTLHNNGIYDMPNKIEIEYHDKKCCFITGEPHHFASYDMLYLILEDFRQFTSLIAEKTKDDKLIKCKISDFTHKKE